jgi:hypothetical protein
LRKYSKEIKEAFEGVISIADHLKNENDDNSYPMITQHK